VGVFYPNAGALENASIKQAALAGGSLRLYKDGFNPEVTTTLAELEAEECDFTGYPAGGITVAAWLNPYLSPAGGAAIESGTQMFEWATGSPDVGNLVGGWFYETAGGMLIVGTFPVATPMEGPGQAIPLNIQLIEGTGQ